MKRGNTLDAAPPPKRVRRSHHRPREICYCARCNGRVEQYAVTVEDHKKRYPRREGPGVAPNDEGAQRDNNQPGPSRNRTLGDITNSPGPAPRSPDRQRPPSSPAPLSPRVQSPARGNTPQARPLSPERLLEFEDDENDLDLGLLPRRPAQPPRAEEDEDRDLPDFEPNDGQDYRFDEYMENPMRLAGRNVEDFGDFMDFDPDLDFNEDDPDERDEYDANFGLPDQVDDPPLEDGPHFQLPDEDAEPEEEDVEPDPDDPVEPGGGCAAFREPDLIRNAYIDAYIQKALYGATSRAIKHQLKAAKRTLSSHPTIYPEDLARMAQSISTVERRLGLDTGDILTTFTLCPACGRRYTSEYLAAAENSACLNENCAGVLFTLKNLASGAHRRAPNKTYQYASIIAWIRHLLILPGIAELFQNWRNNKQGDNGLSQPIPSEEWLQNVDRNRPIGDLADAWKWRSTAAGLDRVVDPDTGNVSDRSPVNPPVRFVSLPFGLSLSMYVDWFQATKEGNYSVGACYIIVNNFPRHMRFKREYMCLAILMPGPKEPNSYELDQMLEPLINELLELKQGIDMTIRQGDPPVYRDHMVHCDFAHLLADLMARIKLGGGSGLKSELNFCLYCRSRLSLLSVIAGYMRQDFEFRSPAEDLNNAFFWKSLPTQEERKAFADFTGNRHTVLHHLPGFHTSTSTPIDTMHLLYLGGMEWIVKQVLVGPGMLTPRYRDAEDPIEIFNACIDRMWLPGNFGRLPPKLGQSNGRIKADQWKLASRILFVPLYLAFRDGDEIGPGNVPRGTRKSVGGKHQTYRAKLLFEQRRKHYASIGEPDLCPPLEQCYPSRNLRFHYRQVLMFCVAINTIDKHALTPNDIVYAQELLQTICTGYAENNIPLPPNFHYMMHLEQSLLMNGSPYNTHVWAMEQANGMIARIRHNGRGKGVLEGTLMRGWWSYNKLQNLISIFRSIPNRSPSDDAIIEDLLVALRGGPEHAQERGTLMAFIAQCRTAYTRLYGVQEPTRLSNQSRVIRLDREGLYDLVVEYCQQVWPDAGIYGRGQVQERYLPPTGAVRNYSFLEHDGIRYGAYTHTSGKGYCYGYIDGRQPVRIERILCIEVPNEPEMRTICALVRRFCVPEREPRLPWDGWAGRSGAASWAHNQLHDIEAIPAGRFSGVFALFDVPMSYGRYWVTVALDSIRPEQGELDVD